ncbi:restriction endonuclease subunit S [Mesorhizobium sp. M0698]|uniref:restriction endonuclease subunit S n=1 Tax=Mesorhizobium sp. M0698 TaxID=2956987 RepID=UPI00333C1CD6
MFREAPDEWTATNLGSLIDFVNGYPFKPEDWEDRGTPIIRIQNLNGSGVFNFFQGMIPARYHVREGDLLFCWSGSRGTSFGARRWNGPLGYLNQHIFRCVVSNSLDFDYAYFLLEGMTAAIEAEAHGGGGLVHIKKSELVKFKTKIPPIDEQRRIAEVLRSVDEAIATARTALEELENAKVLCREAAVERFREHALIEVNTIIDTIDAGWSPDCETSPASEGEWSILKTSSVVWDGYDDTENKRLPDQLEPRPNLEVRTDDILITRAGPVERTGVVAIVDNTAGRRMLSDKLIRIRVDREKAVPLYVSELLSSTLAQENFNRTKSGMAASQTNISQTIVRTTKIPLPPLSDQQDFADEMSAIQSAIKASRHGQHHIERSKVMLRADLLSGRVRVPA